MNKLEETNHVVVKFKKLNDLAIVPTYAMPGDAGMDLTAVETEYNQNKDCYIYHTGLSVEIPKGYAMFIFPRSSNYKTEAYMTNHVGIIDSGYRGEILITYKNRTSYKLSNFINKSIISKLNDCLTRLGLKQYTLRPITNDYEPYKAGDRVAQAVVLPYPQVIFEETEELSDSERGTGGHGSTGN